MSKTHTTPSELLNLVDRSVLLADDRKQRIREVLPRLTPEQLHELSEILTSESAGVNHIATLVVDAAVESNKPGILVAIDRFMATLGKALRRTDEGVERSTEEQKLSHYFDDHAA